MNRLLVIGGARSGKSRYAQARAETACDTRVYLATAQAFDAEMEARIASHRADRGRGWSTVEAPLDLPDALTRLGQDNAALLVDCLTLWTSNLLLAGRDIAPALDALDTAIANVRVPVIFVTNEVGLGIVPENALARRFRDAAGLVNQRVAACVGEVQMICAGLPVRIK